MATTTIVIPNGKSMFPGTFSKDHTVRRLLPVRVECIGCSEGVTNECPECGNDIQPHNFVTCEGSLYLQFFFADNYNPNPAVPVAGWGTWLQLTVVTPAGETLITDMNTIATSWWVSSIDGQSIQFVEIDMAKLCALIGDEQCFYFKITKCRKTTQCTRYAPKYCGEEGNFPDHVPVGTQFFDTTNFNLYQYMVGGWVGIPLVAPVCVYCQQGLIVYVFNGQQWSTQQLNGQQVTVTICDDDCFTETYRIARCEDVVCFLSEFTAWDCVGFFYGTPPEASTVGEGTGTFKMRMCLEGSLEKQSYTFEIEQTEDGDKTIKKTQREAARVRLFALSDWQSKKLANIFMGETWAINDEIWEDNTPVEKNNDISNNWFPDITVTRETCEKSSFTCDE